VKRLVELHGGSVCAESAGPGKGSVFSVRLAIDTSVVDSRSRAATERLPEARRRTGTRVLVVDDNRDTATSLALMLDLNGYDVRTASDGLVALEAAEDFRPDFVLLDIAMPRLDGYETARAMRTRPWGNSVKLFALTGWGQEEDKQRAVEAGFDHHLTKPVDPQLLQQLLDSPRAR
jgi:CheY-like chemotaxis protein